MIIKIMLMLMVSLMFSSCSRLTKGEVVLYRIIGNHVSLASKQGLSVFGTGGAMPKQIHRVIIGYRLKKEVGVEEARPIFLNLAASLLKVANADPELPLYAANYPFDFCNIELSITFVKNDWHYQEPPYIAHMFNIDNDLYYLIFKDDRLIDLHKEDIYDFVKAPSLDHSSIKN